MNEFSFSKTGTRQVIKIDWEGIPFQHFRLVAALNCRQPQWQYVQVTQIAKLSDSLFNRIYFIPTGRMETKTVQPSKNNLLQDLLQHNNKIPKCASQSLFIHSKFLLELILLETEIESNHGVKIDHFLDCLLNITRLYCSLSLHSIHDGC
jgi:hypothetical protein